MNLNTSATLQAVNKVALITVKEGDILDGQQWASVTRYAMAQYSFKMALKLYPGCTKVAVGKEIEQLHSREVFTPKDATMLSLAEGDAIESIMMVKEKRDKSLVGRSCVDVQKQWGTTEKNKSASLTVALGSVFVIAAIEAVEGRDVAVVDLPGAYLNANIDDREEVLMVL